MGVNATAAGTQDASAQSRKESNLPPAPTRKTAIPPASLSRILSESTSDGDNPEGDEDEDAAISKGTITRNDDDYLHDYDYLHDDDDDVPHHVEVPDDDDNVPDHVEDEDEL